MTDQGGELGEDDALDGLYTRRFADPDEARKDRTWPVVTRYLERWLDLGKPVLDIACDRGYFIRNVRATERWATDIRDMRAALPADIRFVQASGLELDHFLPMGIFGTVFMSNYLEHLPSSKAVIDQLDVARRLLAPGGRVVIIQPNIRLTGAAYWDFIDHKVALTERSLVEAAEAAGLRTVRLISHFLPYTTKSRLPVHPTLVRLYLRVPLAWRLFAGQTLYVGELPR